MSRKRPREDDDFELCTEGDEVNDDALSITLSELDPASSPFKVSPVSSPGIFESYSWFGYKKRNNRRL